MEGRGGVVITRVVVEGARGAGLGVNAQRRVEEGDAKNFLIRVVGQAVDQYSTPLPGNGLALAVLQSAIVKTNPRGKAFPARSAASARPDLPKRRRIHDMRRGSQEKLQRHGACFEGGWHETRRTCGTDGRLPKA